MFITGDQEATFGSAVTRLQATGFHMLSFNQSLDSFFVLCMQLKCLFCANINML